MAATCQQRLTWRRLNHASGKQSDKHPRPWKPMSASTTLGPGVPIRFGLQHDQVSGADTETYRAKGNPRNVEHAKGGPHMFDSTEILRHSGAGTEKWLTRLRQGNKAYGLPCYGPAA